MIVQAYENIWTSLVPAGFVVALPINEGGLLPSHAQFGADLAFVIASLRAEGANPASAFHDKLAAKAAVMGHSMGGGASLLAASGDPSIDAVPVLAPANTNPSAITAAASVTAPTLILSGTKDCVAPASQHAVPIFDALASGCRSHVSITGASHCQFGINNVLCSLGEIPCGSPGISRAAQHAVMNDLIGPWLQGVLLSDWQAWQQFEATLAESAGITSEQSCPVSPAPTPACANGVDDDGDGAIDLADTLCQGPWDNDEASNPPIACGLLGIEVLLPLALARLVARLPRRGSGRRRRPSGAERDGLDAAHRGD